jgi:hypothetical protein
MASPYTRLRTFYVRDPIAVESAWPVETTMREPFSLPALCSSTLVIESRAIAVTPEPAAATFVGAWRLAMALPMA